MGTGNWVIIPMAIGHGCPFFVFRLVDHCHPERCCPIKLKLVIWRAGWVVVQFNPLLNVDAYIHITIHVKKPAT